MSQAQPDPPFYWTYANLAQVFGLSSTVLRRRMKEWEREEFPAPLPWSRRDKRWDPASVLRWKARRELRAQAVKPELRAV